MNLKTIYIFGNQDVQADSLPGKILPKLAKKFPSLNFISTDPENLEFKGEDLVIIDTVFGISEVELFESLDNFVVGRKVSVHDFDLAMRLLLERKLGKLGKLTVIGVPPNFEAQKTVSKISQILSSIIAS